MNYNLFRLSHYLGDKDFSIHAEKMINNIIANLENRVTNHMFWFWSSLNYSDSFFELAIAGPTAKQKAKELSLEYLPNAIIAAYNEPSELYLLKDRFVEEETYIYVCVNNTCKFPVTNIKEALKLMDK